MTDCRLCRDSLFIIVARPTVVPLAIPPAIVRPGGEAAHLNTKSAELQAKWNYAYIPAYDFMALVKFRKEWKLLFVLLFSPK
jgi:hypothetical protein